METLETFEGNSKPQKLKATTVEKETGNVGNSDSESDDEEEKDKKGRIVPGKRWVFTAYNEDIDKLWTLIPLDHNCIKYILGRETCPTTGKLHLQGFIQTSKKIRPTEYFSTKNTRYFKAKGSDEDQKYCSKDENYITNMKFRAPLIDPMEGLTLYWWQKQIVDIVKGPVDKRCLWWFWEPVGNVGKSDFAVHLAQKHGALIVSGRGTDIRFAVQQWIEKKDLETVIIDIPRVDENKVCYTAIEQLKAGAFFSGKYESGMCLFNRPHVVVFSNFLPVTEKLSEDRWKIIEITKNV